MFCGCYCVSEICDLLQDMEGHPSFDAWVVARLREEREGGRPFPSFNVEAEGLRFQEPHVQAGR